MKKKKKLVIAGIAAVAVCAAVTGFWIYQHSQTEKETEDVYREVREQVVKQEETVEKEENTVAVPIDFNALKNQNAEAYAWIRIPGTSIDYPVLQSQTDDLFYLTHNIDREASDEGAIFTQKTYNDTDFEDPHTVLYGHNMRSGRMFRDLHEYADRAFFDANREVIIYLPGEIRTYRIFAAYLYDDRHLLHSFDFEDQKVYQEYLNSIFSMRDMNTCIDTEMEVASEDKIITLSTCDGVDQSSRYLVQAVLVSIEN